MESHHAGGVLADVSPEAIGPDDEAYDEARRTFSGNFDKRPAVIVRPVDDDEVSAVVQLAAETGVELAVRSGGHSGAGHSESEGGIVLDLALMKALDIDVEGRTAWATVVDSVMRHPVIAAVSSAGVSINRSMLTT